MFDPSLPETLHKMAKSLGLGGQDVKPDGATGVIPGDVVLQLNLDE